jgi:hypothetical protein
LAIALFAIAGLHFALGQNLSGVLDSTLNYAAGAGEASDHSWGIEEFANLRLRIRTGEMATLYAAFNFIALSGNYLESAALLGSLSPNPSLVSTPVIYGQNYAAGLELERLYFRINGEKIDTEAGLLRMAFGYGQVWGSSDFLNPRNPLFPNARPRGVLGASAALYPYDSLKLMLFAAAPRNPFLSDGGGILPGLSLDKHWDRLSFQGLYAFETGGLVETSGSGGSTKSGIHRFGLSVKADLELGLVADAIYTLNPDNTEGIEGLSAGAGFDYSFLGGDLYLLAEYLYNGISSVTALGFGGSWTNHHYLYGSALYRFNDYCSIALAVVFCFDDLSFSPFATLNYELFQGFSLSLSARVPLDQETLSGGEAGELGSLRSGAKFILNAGARLRF